MEDLLLVKSEKFPSGDRSPCLQRLLRSHESSAWDLDRPRQKCHKLSNAIYLKGKMILYTGGHQPTKPTFRAAAAHFVIASPSGSERENLLHPFAQSAHFDGFP